MNSVSQVLSAGIYVPHRKTLAGKLVSGGKIDSLATQIVLYLSVGKNNQPEKLLSSTVIISFFFISIVLVPST